jgi:hypothetical protein
MNIRMQARIADIVNLIIAKGANFFLTVILFALISRGMDAHAFGEFGYWWSMALMIGGMLIGGFSLALVRVVAVSGTLSHLLAPLFRPAMVLLFTITASFVLLALIQPAGSNYALLFGVLTLFGIAVQGQTVVLSLLRAIEATRANSLATVVIVVLMPLLMLAMLDEAPLTLTQLFGRLAVAFTLSTAAVLLITRREIGEILFQSGCATPSLGDFYANASAFTVVNVFNYAMVNMDFTLFRQIGTQTDFATMATAKVFFERFALPALLVFAGAVSMQVLRHPHGVDGRITRLQVRLTPISLFVMLVVVVGMAMCYGFFAGYIRGDLETISFGWAICAAAGYLFFAINGILFDVLVFRRRPIFVMVHIAVFLAFGCAIQAISISLFGVPGWAVGWLSFNLTVHAILLREGAEMRLSRR